MKDSSEDRQLLVDDGQNLIEPPDNFSGLWEYYWPNLRLKYRAHYRAGQLDGKVACWWDNGQLAQEGQCSNGQCEGLWVDYHQDGTKYKETSYKNSNEFQVRWLEEDGSVREVENYN